MATEAERQRVVDLTQSAITIAKSNGQLMMANAILKELKQIKAEFKDINTIEPTLEKLQVANFQLGALHVIDRLLDILDTTKG